MLRSAAALVAAAGLALALASCGSDSPAATAKGGVDVSTELAQKAKPEKRAAGGGAARTPCAAQLGAVVKSMDSLRTRLVAGLAYEEYVGAVESILGAYEKLAVEGLSLACLRAAGTPAERGINRYIAAGNAWTDCVEVPSCEAASIEADLQAKWHQASEFLSQARRGLRHQPAG